jgi:uncharacterized protein
MQSMSYFAYKLFAPRPSFPHDMTDEEAAIMREHVAYWTQLANEGTAVAFGPVYDPAGVWGLAIVDVDGADDADALRVADPAVTKGLGRGEIYLMPGAITRPYAATAQVAAAAG